MPERHCDHQIQLPAIPFLATTPVTKSGVSAAKVVATIDVLVAVNNSAPVLLRNNAGRENHWLGVKLIGQKSNRDAIGARITYQSGDLKRSHEKVGGGSYLSAHDPRVVLGLGNRPKIDWLEVKWPMPGGATQRFTGLPIDRYITIVEGQAKPQT